MVRTIKYIVSRYLYVLPKWLVIGISKLFCWYNIPKGQMFCKSYTKIKLLSRCFIKKTFNL